MTFCLDSVVFKISFLTVVTTTTLKKKNSAQGEATYGPELHVLEELLDEAAGGQAEHAVGQQVGHL